MGYVYFVPDAIAYSPDREALSRLVERIKADGSRVCVGVAYDRFGMPRVRLSVSDQGRARPAPRAACPGGSGAGCTAGCPPGRRRRRGGKGSRRPTGGAGRRTGRGNEAG